MQKEFEIHVYADFSNDVKYKQLDRLANIVFQCAKDTVGCLFGAGSDPITTIHGYGKFSDYVRVYSALRNNKYNIVWCKWGKDEED